MQKLAKSCHRPISVAFVKKCADPTAAIEKLMLRKPLKKSQLAFLLSEACRRGSLSLSHKVFKTIPGQPNLSMCNDMLFVLKKHQQHSKLVAFFQEQMQKIQPNRKSFELVIESCSLAADSRTAQQYLQEMIQLQLNPQLHSFNAVIAACANEVKKDTTNPQQQLLFQRAVSVYDLIHDQTLQPDVNTFKNLIKCCSKQPGFSEEAILFFSMLQQKVYTNDVQVAVKPNANTLYYLIVALAKDEQLESIMELIDCVGDDLNIDVLDPSIFTAAITACHAKKKLAFGLQIFQTMKNVGVVPDRHTFSSMLLLFALCGEYSRAMALLDQMHSSGLKLHVQIFNSAIQVSGAAGKVDEAEEIFRSISAVGLVPNEYSYFRIIHVLGSLNECTKALYYYNQMQENLGYRTLYVCNAAINACAIAKEKSLAFEIFNDIEKNGMAPDIISFNSMFKSLIGTGHPDNISTMTHLYEVMKKNDVIPDLLTFCECMKISFFAENFKMVERFFSDLVDLKLFPDDSIMHVLLCSYRANSEYYKIVDVKRFLNKYNGDLQSKVISIYTDSDQVEDALITLREMVNYELQVSISTFNSVLRCCRQNERYEDVWDVFRMIEEADHAEPDSKSFSETIIALERLNNSGEALKLLLKMHRLAVLPTADLRNSSIGKYFFDRMEGKLD